MLEAHKNSRRKLHKRKTRETRLVQVFEHDDESDTQSACTELSDEEEEDLSFFLEEMAWDTNKGGRSSLAPPSPGALPYTATGKPVRSRTSLTASSRARPGGVSPLHAATKAFLNLRPSTK